MSDEADLHADLDSFYASVEQRDDPRLRGRPVIVGPGIVLAASYEAKAHGVRTAMGATKARRLCPQAVVVPARFEAYSEASKAVFEIFEDTTPLVEGLSIDEAFLDARAGADLGHAHRDRHAPARAGARGGRPADHRRDRSDQVPRQGGQCGRQAGRAAEVAPEAELDFLHPLPVESLWGVGQVTAAKLNARGIETVAEVARLGETALVSMLGKGSAGTCTRSPTTATPARADRAAPPLDGSQRALGLRVQVAGGLDATLVAIVDRLARRLQAARRVCRTVVLRLRFADFSRATRSHTINEATAHTQTILVTARRLLAAPR